MARAKAAAVSLEVREFSLPEIDRGISKLRRRIEEVRALDPNSVEHNDAAVDVVEHNIQSSILEIFGQHSPEYKEYHNLRIWHNRSGWDVIGEDYDAQQRFSDGIPHTITILENLVKRLEERRADLAGSPPIRAKVAIEGLDLHPRIAEAAIDLYRDGHCSNAVFEASKALINYVKERSGRHDLDGASLVRTVFSKQNPVLVFNDLKEQSDCDEQEGLMHLFEGAVLGVRNPRGHSSVNDSPERALEYLSLLSLLAHRLQAAKKRK